MSRISYIMSAAAIFGDVISLKEDASGLTFPPSCDITNLLQQVRKCTLLLERVACKASSLSHWSCYVICYVLSVFIAVGIEEK